MDFACVGSNNVFLNADCLLSWLLYKKLSAYDQAIPNHTLETDPRHYEEEPQNTNSESQDIRKTIKAKQPALSSPLR